jgi:hypothetical protein
MVLPTNEELLTEDDTGNSAPSLGPLQGQSKGLSGFCGCTRMVPRRGLSMSAVAKKEMLKTNGNTSRVLLTALAQKSLDARVAEALPWVAMKYAQPDQWLVENARKFSLRNRLGFVVSLARRVAEMRHEGSKATELTQLENLLDDSRLAKENSFYRPPRTESEKEWLRKNRTEDAAHWNLLTDMRPEHLSYAS